MDPPPIAHRQPVPVRLSVQQAMEGAARPVTALSRGRAADRRQLLRGLDGGKTTEPGGPMNQLLQRCMYV